MALDNRAEPVEDRVLRLPVLRTRTLMKAVAWLALLLAVLVQSIRLEQTLARSRTETHQRQQAEYRHRVKLQAQAQALKDAAPSRDETL